MSNILNFNSAPNKPECTISYRQSIQLGSGLVGITGEVEPTELSLLADGIIMTLEQFQSMQLDYGDTIKFQLNDFPTQNCIIDSYMGCMVPDTYLSVLKPRKATPSGTVTKLRPQA